jgi:AraC family transcriptional regulator of adaptative response / DNA-3-methyladenine glycosylase II
MSVQPGYVRAVLNLRDLRDLAPAVARCRRLFDLDADPVAVDATLGADPSLAAAVAKEPGVRVPGAVDGFEMAVRAIVGQQISVVGARKILGRLTAAVTTTAPTAVAADARRGGVLEIKHAADSPSGHDHGELAGFPSAEEVARAPDAAFAMPAARRRTLRALAEAVAGGDLHLDPGADRSDTRARLLAIAGIGTWTAQYVAMRALADPDICPTTDLGVRRGAATLGLSSDPAELAAHAHSHWAPWRTYATIRLWRQG